MRVTTAPPKRKFLTQQDMAERANRVKITVLEFCKGNTLRYDFSTIEDLKPALSRFHPDEDVNTRLFVVEDISTSVIEALGARFDVDPMFFRGYISDYTWYNTRDPWTELPEMDIVSRKRSYINVRYAHARYFRAKESYARARVQAGRFNVLRRVDRDETWVPGADTPGSSVGMVRSRMSFWSQPRDTKKSITLNAILLVDPSITEGFPLWGGYNNFVPCPSITEQIEPKPTARTTFESIVYWLERNSAKDLNSTARAPKSLFLQPLCVVCSEWLTLITYAHTCLSQLEWEIEDPNLRHRHKNLSATLDKIHTWRRRLPIFKNIVSEIRTEASTRGKEFDTTANSTRRPDNPLRVLERDLEIIWSKLTDLHERAENTMSVVTAVMSIEESNKSFQQGRSLARLTYLAVTFVPLSFMSSFFSMNDDLTKLGRTFWIYFVVAIPTTIVALVVVIYSDSFANVGRQLMGRMMRGTAQHHSH